MRALKENEIYENSPIHISVVDTLGNKFSSNAELIVLQTAKDAFTVTEGKETYKIKANTPILRPWGKYFLSYKKFR